MIKMFKVGDYVVYKRDLCIIKEITNNKYYKLALIDDETLTISVLIENKLGYLRYPLSKKEANQIISTIPLIEPLQINEKLLENEYKNLLKTNKHEDLIKIIKTTYLRNTERIKTGKKIGEKDQTYFELAEKYLYNELSYDLNMTYEECKEYIIECVTKINGDNNE